MAERMYEDKQMRNDKVTSTVSGGNQGTKVVVEKDSVSYVFQEGPEPKEAEYSEIIVSEGGTYGETTESGKASK